MQVKSALMSNSKQAAYNTGAPGNFMPPPAPRRSRFSDMDAPSTALDTVPIISEDNDANLDNDGEVSYFSVYEEKLDNALERNLLYLQWKDAQTSRPYERGGKRNKVHPLPQKTSTEEMKRLEDLDAYSEGHGLGFRNANVANEDMAVDSNANVPMMKQAKEEKQVLVIIKNLPYQYTKKNVVHLFASAGGGMRISSSDITTLVSEEVQFSVHYEDGPSVIERQLRKMAKILALGSSRKKFEAFHDVAVVPNDMRLSIRIERPKK